MHINHDTVLKLAQGLDQKTHVVLSRVFSCKFITIKVKKLLYYYYNIISVKEIK